MEKADKRKLQQAFGKTIGQLRLEQNISQAKLAERGNFNRTYISDLERGIKQPSLSTIVRLAYAFEMKSSELIEQFEKLFEIK